MAHLFLKLRVLLKWLLQALPVDVILPAMIGAPKPVTVDKTVIQGGMPVRTMFTQEPVPLFSVFCSTCGKSEQHQIFSKDPYSLFPLLFGQFRSNCDRMPVSPEEFATGRRRPDLCQQLVCLFGKHAIVP